MDSQETLLDYATIKAAVAGEKWATEKVIKHYAPLLEIKTFPTFFLYWSPSSPSQCFFSVSFPLSILLS